MGFPIVIGNATQPTTGFAIVMGDETPGGALITFDVPDAPKGTVLLVLIVRTQPLLAPEGWDLILNGNGGEAYLLDVYAHTVDNSDIRAPGEATRQVSFGSLESQELQGQIFAYENSSPGVIIEAVAGEPFVADATPAAPAPLTQQAINTVVGVWSAAGAVDLTAPTGFAVIDSYTSNVVEERSILIAHRIANQTGTISVPEATADPAATGVAWTLILRNGPPATPPELFDTVPGHIGLI